MQGVFDKLIRGIAAFERELKKSGEEFMWDDHLGYIVSDPIYLGTALDVRVRVKLHHLSTVRISKPAWFASVLISYGRFYVWTNCGGLIFGHFFGRFDTGSDSQSGGPGFESSTLTTGRIHFSVVCNSVPRPSLIVT